MAGGQRRAGLLSDAELERSAVVANCAMNRERQLAGVNSYARELGFSPLGFLWSRLGGQPPGTRRAGSTCAAGTGRALIQAAGQLTGAGLAGQATLTGVDPAGVFDPVPDPAAVRLVTASAACREPDRTFDLIACVHGLHYIGDKLAVLIRAASWLAPGGLMAADLDLRSIRFPAASPPRGGWPAGCAPPALPTAPAATRSPGPAPPGSTCAYTYLGADDQAAPGCTGQPAVESHYDEIPPRHAR